MKKYLIIGGLCCITTIPSAMAVTKCVKLNINATCTKVRAQQFTTDWEISCNSVPVKGVTGCAADGGGVAGATSSYLSTSENARPNRYCWCKMVSPAVSQWVYLYDYETTAGCMRYCGEWCGNHIAEQKSALFDNLSD